MELMELTANSGMDEFYSAMHKECLNDRILVFNQEVDDGLIEDFVLYILKWNKEDKDIPIEKRKPITIIMNSIGGSPFSGGALVAVIMASKTPVRAVGIGMVASACFDIYISCDERISFDNVTYLLHDGGIELSTSSKKMKETVEYFTNTMAEHDKHFVLNRTNMTEEFYDSVYGEEFYMYAEKAKELGVVHKIIGKDIELDDIF